MIPLHDEDDDFAAARGVFCALLIVAVFYIAGTVVFLFVTGLL